ncbi:MAG: response regulator [candidate division NC10 bacterium]|nr:response regulator [candidate division NC10 bacterium]
MGHRVLVVDDHLMSLELVSVLLAQEGNQVLAATSGEVGLCLAAAEAPDLILMDLQLPGMTGYEAIRRLKADPVTAAIPVLALTGSAMKGDDLKVGFSPQAPRGDDPRGWKEWPCLTARLRARLWASASVRSCPGRWWPRAPPRSI